MEVVTLKELKNVWRSLHVIAAVFFLCCMSVLTVFADEGEIVLTEENAELFVGTSREDGQVRLYTYTIKDADGNIAGTMELRYGMYSRSRLLWIASERSQQKLEQIRGWSSVAGNIRIPLEQWNHYFQEGAAYTYEVSEKVLKLIFPVENIRWSEKSGEEGYLSIDWYSEENMNVDDKIYFIRIFLDEEVVDEFVFERLKPERSTQIVSDSVRAFNKSGTYTAAITVYGKTTAFGDSEEVSTAPLEYQMPARIGKVNEIRWKAKSGETIPAIVEWDAVEYASSYEINLTVYEDGKKINAYGRSVNGRNDTKEALQFDWSVDPVWSYLQEYAKKEKVNFEVSIRPISYNIMKKANGEETIEREYKFYDEVSGAKAIFTNTTVESVLEDVEKAGIENVAAAMQTDKEFLAKMEKLEQDYMLAHPEIKVNQEIKHQKLSGDIKIVGTAMNVSGGAVTVNFSEVKKGQEKKINRASYTNAVQVDINLNGAFCDNVKNNGVLVSPITITMSPPTGVNLSKVVILHYHDTDEKPEEITPAVQNEKITFSVTKFSTFVFAEKVTTSKKPESNRSVGSGLSSVSSARIQTYGTIKKFIKADGSIAKSEWVKNNGKWYYAGADGALMTGWYQNAAGVWYYLQSSCEMATNWQRVNGKWYYLDSTNGDMKTSWLQTADGKWYYLDPKNGEMTEGWQFVNGKWYYLNPISGEMATGWKLIGGKWYFLTKNGDCLLNTVTPDGYKVDKNGVWIP